MTTRIGVYLFDDAEELDWAGPWEVLSYWALTWPEDDVEVFTFAREDGVVTCAKGLKVVPDHSWETAPTFDVLVYPGGIGTRAQLADEAVRQWLVAAKERGALMTSVCSGALVFAASGLLMNLPATTYWSLVSMLTEIDPTITPRPDDRFVDTGDVITAAGVSAGIDMALHLVKRLHSADRAREVRRGIQYDPKPPV